jgi:hypothetical protein
MGDRRAREPEAGEQPLLAAQLDDGPLQSDTGHQAAVGTHIFAIAHCFFVLPVAFDADHGVAAFLDRAFLQFKNGAQESPLASFLGRLVEAIGLLIGFPFAQVFLSFGIGLVPLASISSEARPKVAAAAGKIAST